MPNRYTNVKACPVCGRKNWRTERKTEPIDRTGLTTREKRTIQFRVCKQCGYSEQVETY